MKKSFWSKFPGVNSYKALCAWPLLDLHLPSHSALSPSLVRLLLAHWAPPPPCLSWLHLLPGGPSPSLSSLRLPLTPPCQPQAPSSGNPVLTPEGWSQPRSTACGWYWRCALLQLFISLLPLMGRFPFFESSYYVLCLRMSQIRDSELETVSDFFLRASQMAQW